MSLVQPTLCWGDPTLGVFPILKVKNGDDGLEEVENTSRVETWGKMSVIWVSGLWAPWRIASIAASL